MMIISFFIDRLQYTTRFTLRNSFEVVLIHSSIIPQWYANKLQELVDEGIDLETDIQIPVVKCIAGSGILGKAVYYKLFPEEMTESVSEELEKERKN